MTRKLNIPQIIGHRGAMGYAPENTLASIHTAADMGVKWVEIDVKLTKDGVPIIFHDDALDRTTNGFGLVAETNYEDIKQLECGLFFSESFGGAKISTLEEVIEVLIERGMGLNLEIKPCAGREIETAEIALDVLAQYWDDHENLLISSFSEDALAVAYDMALDWGRALCIQGDWPDDWLKKAKALEVSALVVDGMAMNEDIIREINAAGYKALAYNSEDPERARILQGWGVTGFFSDEPDMMEDAILSVH